VELEAEFLSLRPPMGALTGVLAQHN
jgi:hypothetical protein